MQAVPLFLKLFCLSTLLAFCTHKKPESWNGPTLSQPRSELTVAQLLNDSTFALMDMSFFTEPEWAKIAPHPFSGSISIKATKLLVPVKENLFPGEDLFPGITIDFIVHDGELIPMNKGLLKNQNQSDNYWRVLIGTGKVWQEQTDDGWSRASFPLTLTESYMGQARNCVGTFVYNHTDLSNICLQCSQETTNLELLHPGNIRATLKAKYEVKHYADSANVIEAHEKLRSQRLPVFPLSEIDIDGELAHYFEKKSFSNAPTSLGAIMMDEKIYLHPPKTRHGPYPFPGEMRHCIFSATKSMAGSLSLLYLAQRYGDNIFNEFITEYVPALADHPGWQGVTFAHTLNMVTGTVGSERNEHFRDILVLPRTAEECINHIATLMDAPGVPGERFNYGPTNTFVLSYAMQKYVESKEGKDVTYWDLVHKNVLLPLGAAYFTLRKTVEREGTPGIPILSYGAIPTLDEAAKISLLFQNSGAYQGQQLLHREKTREAMGRTAWDGYGTDDDFRGSRYHHGFWSKPIKTKQCAIEVTYMLGYGENYVLFLPSEAIILRFMDEHDLDFSDLVKRVENITSSCPKE